MDPIVTSGIIQGGASLLGLGIGGLQQNAQNRRQKNLMNLQLKNQMKLNQQGADLSYENWLRTNYSAQRAEMEKAGLNVGMMYGGSGQGGTLTGGGGGSAAGGQAAAPNNQMAMLLGDLAAGVELKKAQARNLNVDSDNKEGVEREKTYTEIDNLKQGIQNQKAQEALTRTQNDIAGLEWELRSATIDKAKELVNQQVLKVQKENYILEKQGEITKVEADNIETKTKLQLSGMYLNNILTNSQNENVRANTAKTREEANVIFKDYLLRSRNTDTNQRRMLNDQTAQQLGRMLQEKGLNQQETKMWLDSFTNIMGMGVYGKGVETKQGTSDRYGD